MISNLPRYLPQNIVRRVPTQGPALAFASQISPLLPYQIFLHKVLIVAVSAFLTLYTAVTAEYAAWVCAAAAATDADLFVVDLCGAATFFVFASCSLGSFLIVTAARKPKLMTLRPFSSVSTAMCFHTFSAGPVRTVTSPVWTMTAYTLLCWSGWCRCS